MSEEEQNKRKGMLLLAFGVLTLLVLVAGATYAYFQAHAGNAATANLDATTGTTDNITFNLKDKDVADETHKIVDENNKDGEIENTDIIINANSSNFTKEGNSIGDGVTGTINLKANNANYTAKKSYNVYLQIEENELKYSSYKKDGESQPKVFKTESAKEEADLDGYTPVPELILLVKGPDDKFNGISGLDQATLISENDGYDITEKTGLITIAENVTIETTGEELKEITDEWEIEVILKNLETDQNLNTGKKLTGKVIISPDKIGSSGSTGGGGAEGTGVCQPGETIQACLTRIDQSQNPEEPTLLYHNGTINVGGQVMDAGDNSYRYSGESSKVNNYVCFGGECSNNPDEDNYANLYRIIGVFPTEATKGLSEDLKIYQMKIIKADATTEDETGGDEVGAYYGKYSNVMSYYTSNYKGDKQNYLPKIAGYNWNYSYREYYDGKSTNDWSKSNLNIENLNGTYLSYIQGKDNEKWYNMIEEDHTWITAGNNWDKIGTQNSKTVYDNEIKNPAVGDALSSAATTYPARVGLMYVSDYMYAATTESWATVASSYSSAASKNWMDMGFAEWTITRQADDSYAAFYFDSSGNMNYDGYYVGRGAGVVRPVLYLNSSVKITSGSGTSTDPFHIEM